ncbi:hypothetical protein, partial [Pararhodobacter aggregans]|uniref:hypothetical protein n=1 Tax=Pararhodobacter aggregans TaxID=404875 RepID=UPI003A910220
MEKNRPNLHFFSCGFRPWGLDTASPKRRGRGNANEAATAAETPETNLDARRAKALGNWRRLRVVFGTLFENLVNEGICGRFGSFRWIGRLDIGLLASAMIEVSASLFC